MELRPSATIASDAAAMTTGNSARGSRIIYICSGKEKHRRILRFGGRTYVEELETCENYSNVKLVTAQSVRDLEEMSSSKACNLCEKRNSQMITPPQELARRSCMLELLISPVYIDRVNVGKQEK